jgi:ABC-2 type transport system permease protein
VTGMDRSILRQELRMKARSVAVWSAALAGLIAVFTSLFSGFAGQAALMNEWMANFPKELLIAFGLTNTDLSTILGYYGYVFFFAQLCLAIQASGYGLGLVSMEEREWTADFLLAKPVGRSRILSSKLLAALCALAVTDAVVCISSYVCLSAFGGGATYDAGRAGLMLVGVVPFQVFFLSVGLLISLLARRIRSVTPYAMALGLGMYLLSVFGDLLGSSALEYLTPFRHFDPKTVIENGAYDVPLVLISVSVMVLSLAASYRLYARRDIPAVV